jgi:hypothetical protein
MAGYAIQQIANAQLRPHCLSCGYRAGVCSARPIDDIYGVLLETIAHPTP